MTILIFILTLGALVFVHELGHFWAAKSKGIRVDEFALGFPPRLFSYQPKGSETRYSLNLLPLGGYVKIHGENPDEESMSGEDSERSFVNQKKRVQILVLLAGITMNFLFAWALYAVSFSTGMPSVVTPELAENIENVETVITGVAPESPAGLAGLKAGDRVVSISNGMGRVVGELTPEVFAKTTSEASEEVTIHIRRGEELLKYDLEPITGLVANDAEKKAVGVLVERVGILRLPVHEAIWESGKTTVAFTGAIIFGVADLLVSAVSGNADLGSLTGPVGIAGMAGDAAQVSFATLLSFAAFLSLNLVILNALPFPALDGGRILFVFIEKIKGSPIKPVVANTVNALGFGLLLLLMLVVTVSDIAKLF